jgi:hypothetical protein
MSDDKKDPPKKYAPENTGPDGSYLVGKGRPPSSGKFAVDDGRKRGRREKGTKNLATDFLDEMAKPVTLSVNGEQKKVSRQRAIVMRLLDNASRGQSRAIDTAFKYRIQFGGGSAPSVPEDAAASEKQPYASLENLDEQELDEFYRLHCKAAGVPYDPPEREKRTDPLAYIHDPDNPHNYIPELTVEGLHLVHCRLAGAGTTLTGIDNHAYISGAMSRKPGAWRRQF